MSFDNLLIERETNVAVLTIHRPQRLNALDTRTLSELQQALLDLQHDPDTRVIIITGAGDKAFVAGADISELATDVPEAARARARMGQRVFESIETLGKPVIAAINGFALGGGCELAMACTIRIAAESARLGLPEINLGLIPGFGGTQRLPRLIGKGRAAELILSGAPVTAQQALQMGLVNRVFPDAELMREARSLAQDLASKPPIAVRTALDAINLGLEMPLSEALAFEASLFGLVSATEDKHEGTRAFLEKRKPTFKGK